MCIRKQIVMTVLILLVISIVPHLGTNSSPKTHPAASESADSIQSSVVVAYVDHAPIIVQDDDDFEDGDWQGEGTYASPYTISGLKFNTSSIGVSIEKTTAHFKISNCLFVGDCSTIGIWFSKLQNGIVEDSYFVGLLYGISSEKSEDILVNESTFSDCENGIYLEKTNNTTIIDSTFTSLDTAISTSKSEELGMESCVFTNNEYSLYFNEGQEISIEDCTFQEGGIGILAEDIQHIDTSSSVFSTLQYASFLSESEEVTVQNSEIVDCVYGIYVLSSIQVTLIGNSISDIDYGIYFSSTDVFNITSNLIQDGDYDGINIRYSDDGEITYNIVQNNNRYGIRLVSSNGIIVFGNEIGWNKEANAADFVGTLAFTPTNQWDDGSSLGNGYNDYSGTGTYIISGTMASVDRYPRHILSVTSPEDITIEYGSEGAIEWEASALNPDTYRITNDSEILVEDDWVMMLIGIELPAGLLPGTYNYTLWLNTTSNRVISDSVKVIIQDTANPEWTVIPENQNIEFGEDFSYLLQASDLSGISYYWVNDTTRFEIVENLIENLEVLPIGSYGIEVRAFDQYDNFCSATITVTVQDTVLPEITHPQDVEYVVGDLGNTIEWTFNDNNPSSYQVYLNNELFQEGLWNESSDSISVNIDGLAVGMYTFRCVIYDQGSNSVYDQVSVVVTDTTSTSTTETTTSTTETTDTRTNTTSTETTEDDLMTIQLLAVGVGAGGVVVVLALIAKKGFLTRR